MLLVHVVITHQHTDSDLADTNTESDLRESDLRGESESTSRARAVALRVLLYGLDQIEWRRPVTKRTESSLTVYQLIF